MDERNYWLAFSRFPGIGPMKFKRLLARFDSAKNAWQAPGSHLAELLGEKLTEKFDEFRNKFSIEGYVSELAKKDVSFIILADKEYPKLLSQIKNPPFVLYAKGNVEILRGVYPELDRRAQNDRGKFQDDPTAGRRSPEGGSGQAKYIAVVGTRRTTQYGREVTKILTEELVAAGFTIVSGLAIGVDAISHITAVEGDGKTIAVLGCGVDCCYPTVNQHIYNSIVNGSGCIVSEFPLGVRPTKGSFPSRNRIIAGLSLGVLVTEGAEDSGSLITADYARKFGRPIFAVPGPITSSMSKGPFALIQKGAKLVTSSRDIISELGISNFQFPISNKPKITGTKEENMLLKLLRNEPLHFDEIVRKTGLQSSSVGGILSVMEIKGMIKSLDGGVFSCIINE